MHTTRPAVVLASTTLGLVAPLLSTVTPAQSTGLTYISFDDVPLSCNFSTVGPLRGRYAAAKFKGPGADDGGAVLDNCASFGVAPRTGARFLAFNSTATMVNGGTPTGPEKISFTTRQKRVTVWVSQGGSPGDTTFRMVARRGHSVVRTTSSTTTTSAYVELTVGNRRGIDSVTVNAPVEPNGAWVLDDLTTVR